MLFNAHIPVQAAASTDISYLVLGGNTSPYYKLYNGDLNIATVSADLPTGGVMAATFSPDKAMMALAMATTPFVQFYTIDGTNAPVKLANPATLPTYAESVDWSPDGRWVVVGHDTSPFITIYDMSSGAPVKLANPAVLPTSRPQQEGVRFSPDGTFLAICQRLTPFMLVYDISGSTFTALTNPATLPEAQTLGVDIADDNASILWSVATSTGNTCYLVNKSGATLTKLAYPSGAGSGSGRAGRFIKGSKGFFMGNGSALERYTFDGTAATNLADATSPSFNIVASDIHLPSGTAFVTGSTQAKLYAGSDGFGRIIPVTGNDEPLTSLGLGNINCVAMI